MSERWVERRENNEEFWEIVKVAALFLERLTWLSHWKEKGKNRWPCHFWLWMCSVLSQNPPATWFFTVYSSRNATVSKHWAYSLQHHLSNVPEVMAREENWICRESVEKEASGNPLSDQKHSRVKRSSVCRKQIWSQLHIFMPLIWFSCHKE